jgi:hypothetical protein
MKQIYVPVAVREQRRELEREADLLLRRRRKPVVREHKVEEPLPKVLRLSDLGELRRRGLVPGENRGSQQ